MQELVRELLVKIGEDFYYVCYSGKLKQDGYEVIGGPRTTGDGYYESCIIGIEGNQIELMV